MAVAGNVNGIIFPAAVHLDQTLLGEDVQTDPGLTEAQGLAHGTGDLPAQAGKILPQPFLPAVGHQIPPDRHEFAANRQQLRRLLGAQGLPIPEAAVEILLLLGFPAEAVAEPDVDHVQLHRAGALELVDLGREGHVHAVPQVDAGLERGLGKEDRRQQSALRIQIQPQVLAAPHLGELDHNRVPQAEHRNRTAGAAGLHPAQAPDVFDGQQLRLHRAVHLQGEGPPLAGKIFRGHGGHCLPEAGNVLPLDGKAGSQLVTAVALQQVRDLGQGGEQIEAPIAPGGGLAPVAVHADQEGGAVVLLRQAGGHDAHHALVPGLPCQDDGLGLGIRPQHFGGLLIDHSLHLLPLPIEPAEIRCQSLGLVGVLGQKQLQRLIHLAHPAGGVDPGRQQIAHRGGGDRLSGAAAFPHQGGNAGPRGLRQGLHAPDHHGPDLPVQGHHVRHQTQAEQIGIPLQQTGLVAADGGGQLEGNAHAGEIGMGIGAVGPVGIHHSRCPGQGLLALMVIGDDQVHAQPSAELRLGIGGDAAVHRNDQIHLLPIELPDGDLIQAVALLQSGRDIAGDPGAHLGQKIRQQGGGGNAVHVVISEHGNMLPPCHGKAHPIGGKLHILHQEGRVQGRVAAEILLGGRRIGAAPGGQRTGTQRPIPCLFQLPHRNRIIVRHIPVSKLHANTHPKFFFF